MSDNKDFWESYFSGESDAPDYRPPEDDQTKIIQSSDEDSSHTIYDHAAVPSANVPAPDFAVSD